MCSNLDELKLLLSDFVTYIKTTGCYVVQLLLVVHIFDAR